MKKIEMIKGAKKLVDDCTRVKKGENVLIITDTCMPLSIAQVLAMACKERGAETMVMIMSPLQAEVNDLSFYEDVTCSPHAGGGRGSYIDGFFL